MPEKKTVILKVDAKRWIELELDATTISEKNNLAFASFCDYNERKQPKCLSNLTGWNKPLTVFEMVGSEIWNYLVSTRNVKSIYFPVMKGYRIETLLKVTKRFLKRHNYYGEVKLDEGGFEVRFDTLKTNIVDQ